MVLDVGTLTMGPVFYKNLPFEPATAFAPVTALTFSPLVLAANPALYDAQRVALDAFAANLQ